jgi:DNA-binding beta-propeller fold protein YncE
MKKAISIALCVLVLFGLAGCGKAPVQYTLTITISGAGTVTPASGSKYGKGTVVTLAPTAADGWAFASWSGPDGADVVSSETHIIMMDKDKRIEAVFTPLTSVSGVVKGKKTAVGIPDVIIKYSGAISGYTVTDATGHYTIPDVTGPITVEPLGTIYSMAHQADPASQEVAGPSSKVDFLISGIAWDSNWQIQTGDNHPGRIAIDSVGRLYVTIPEVAQVRFYRNDGVELFRWGTKGAGYDQMLHPTGIAIDRTDHVYVADEGNNRVQKFTNYSAYVTTLGGYGESPGKMIRPIGLTVDAADNLYVLESQGQRVQVFSSTGTLWRSWDGSGSGYVKFNYPTGIALDSSGNVYVVDQGNDLIRKFDSNGVFITQWGRSGHGQAEFYLPEDIAIYDDHVFVVDKSNDRIQIFTSDGAYVGQWGMRGSGIGQFDLPCGIAIDRAGNIYIADTYNNRIQRFYQYR